MKRELVILVAIGVFLWLGTGLSVLAVAVFDGGGENDTLQVSQASDRLPGVVALGDRSKDEITSAPLCEPEAMNAPCPDTPADAGEGCPESGASDACGPCLDHRLVALLTILTLRT